MTQTISVFFPNAAWLLSTRISLHLVLSSIMTSKTLLQWCRPTIPFHPLKTWFQPLDLCPVQYKLPLYPKCLFLSSVNSSISQILLLQKCDTFKNYQTSWTAICLRPAACCTWSVGGWGVGWCVRCPGMLDAMTTKCLIVSHTIFEQNLCLLA